MKTKRRWLHIVLLLLVMLLSGYGKAQAAAADDGRDKSQPVLLGHADKPQALLTDTSWQLRLCSQRPERVSVPHTYPPVRHLSLRHHHSSHIHNVSLARYRAYGLPLSAPIRLSLPCRYYVLALQRLLC